MRLAVPATMAVTKVIAVFAPWGAERTGIEEVVSFDLYADTTPPSVRALARACATSTQNNTLKHTSHRDPPALGSV